MAIIPLSVATEGVAKTRLSDLYILGWASDFFAPGERCTPSIIFPESIGLFGLTSQSVTFRSIANTIPLVKTLNSSASLVKTLTPASVSLMALNSNIATSKPLVKETAQSSSIDTEAQTTKPLVVTGSTSRGPAIEPIITSTPTVDPELTPTILAPVDEC